MHSRSRGHTKTTCNSCLARAHVRDFKQRCVNHLGGKCKRCGYNRSIWALHVHHRDPSFKSFKISGAQWRNWRVVVLELDKCDLLCANCHAEEHAASYPTLKTKGRRRLRENSINWPDKRRLELWVQRTPLTGIALKLGVSDSAVKKRCKKLGIQTTPRGGWSSRKPRE